MQRSSSWLALPLGAALSACSSSPSAESVSVGDEAAHACSRRVIACPAPGVKACITEADGCPFCECGPAPLHFTNAAYSIWISIAGNAPQLVQLDTGSVGLFVPASAVPTSAISTEACNVTYVSSGLALSGHVANTAVALLGDTLGGELASAPTTGTMPICAVDSPSTFTGAARGLMGVGFGQLTKPQNPAPDPTWNVLLQVQGILNPGYVLSTHPTPSVQIGIGGDTSNFNRVNLTAAANGDWLSSSLLGCLTLTPPGGSPFSPACAPLLVDTGVANAYLWGLSDPALAGRTTVPAGSTITITSPAGAATLDYAFTVGSGSDSPAAVNIAAASTPALNTGRALLTDYDYLFDALNGQVGFAAAN